MAKKLEVDLNAPSANIVTNTAEGLKDQTYDLVGVGGLEHWGVSPLVRTQAGDSVAAKEIVSTMMESPLITKGNVKGISTTPVGGSVETRIKLHDAPLVESIVDLEDLYTSYRQGKGKLNRAVNDYVLRNRAGKLSMTEFREEVGKALRRGDKSQIPEVQKAAESFRKKVLDPLKDSAIELKMLPEDLAVDTATSYLSRVYKAKKIVAERDTWDNIVSDWLNKKKVSADSIDPAIRTDAEKLDALLTPEKISKSVDSITDNILGNASGRGAYQLKSTAGPLKSRVFLISDEAIEDFLESDIDLISRQYTRSMGPDVELTKAFGDTGMEKQLTSIKEDFNVKIREAKNAKERIKLEDKKKTTLRDVEAMRDRLLGTYRMPEDPTSFFSRANRALRDVNFMRMLGSMTLSAIPDMARPIAVNGLRPVAKGLMSLAKSPKRFNIARKQAKSYAVGLDMVLNSRASSMAEITDIYARGTAFERGMRATSDVFSKMTLMSQWNASIKQFSGVITADRLLTQAINRSTGKITKSNLKRLASAGISEDMAGKIAKQFETHGDDGSLKLSNGHLWDDKEAFETFKAAVLKDVDRTIVTPGKGEPPLWTSGEMGKLIFQFKSFAGSAHHKILLADLQYRDAAALNGFLMSVALGTVTYGLKNVVAGREVSTDPAKVIVESLDRSGGFGYFWDINNTLEKWSHGEIGVNKLSGAPPMSRYVSRNMVSSLLGPSFGTVTDMATTSGNIATGEFTKKDLRRIRKMIPGQNLFYMRNLLNQLEDKAGRGLKK